MHLFSCMCLCKIPICWNEVNMYSQIRTSMLDGICAMPVQVEVDISMGMPVFDMVGYLSPEVREAKERVRTALHNCGILLPAKRITVNLSPANIRKTGTGFDLPIAVALLVAWAGKTGEVRGHDFSGELNLSGQLLPVRGVLPMVSDGVKEGIHKFVVPADNLMESRLVQGADVCGFSALESVIGYLQDGGYKEPAYAGRRQNRSMGCRIFRSKRAAVFETGSGNRSVRNAQYAYGRAAGSRKNHDLRADGYNPAATYKKRAAGGFKNIQCLRSAGRLPDTVAGTAVSQSASYGQHGRACRRWTKYPAGRDFTGTSWCAFSG